MPRAPRNPADIVLRCRVREPIHFPDLTEHMALRLSAVATYTGRAHFGLWHRRVAVADFSNPTGVFTPLIYVDVEVTDRPVDPRAPFRVQGETYLGKAVDDAGAVRHLLREGRHAISDAQGTPIARAHYVNALTRYTTDPAQRRVTELPPHWNLGTVPSRVLVRPQLADLLPVDRPPDVVDATPSVWHYGQTDANRHVNSMEYLRAMELFVADTLFRAGHDLRRAYFVRARIAYRKPCFRGEGYRRVAWLRGEAPLVVAGAFRKATDPDDAPPAVAVELTLAQHDG